MKQFWRKNKTMVLVAAAVVAGWAYKSGKLDFIKTMFIKKAA